MTQLELTEQEVEVLTEIVESYLSDLSMEIADTDRLEYREGLKDSRALIASVLSKLKVSEHV